MGSNKQLGTTDETIQSDGLCCMACVHIEKTMITSSSSSSSSTKWRHYCDDDDDDDYET